MSKPHKACRDSLGTEYSLVCKCLQKVKRIEGTTNLLNNLANVNIV